MESMIKWQTGAPEEEWCFCLVTTKYGQVSTAMWLQERGWMSSNLLHRYNDVIAWCKLSDIKPYKEETK